VDLLTSLLGRNGYLPHGYCFTWTPGLLWSMVGADAVIATAYFSIPLAIVQFIRKRTDSAWSASWNWVAGLFSAFIFACGVTHVMDIWTVWRPDYGLQALTKVVTAGVSILTAIALWPLLPRLLRIPSVGQLQESIRSLEDEVQKRRTAEEHLTDTQQILAATLASIGAGFIATDREGRVTHMNAVAQQMMGWTQEEALGQSLWTVFVRDGRPAGTSDVGVVDWLVGRGMDLYSADDQVAIARDGKRTLLEVRGALTYAEDGSVRGVAIVFRDMTPLKRAEAESMRLAAIVESSNDAIIGQTMDGRITSWNRAAQALFGYGAAEALGQSEQMLVPPECQAEDRRVLEALARGVAQPAFDTVRLAKDGRRLEVSVAMSLVLDAQGIVMGASKIVRDVSHQRRVEALEAENRQILEANRLKSQFLANMSHELRTPLNAIIGFADLLHSGAVPAESSKHGTFVGHIATSGRHLLQLINDVLDLSKVESGKFEFFPERVNLSQLVTEVRDILQTAIARKHLVFTIDIDPTLGDLVLDPARLKQVLYNYLSNAIKFTPEGGRVTVRARAEGPAHFRLEVEDTGVGIAEADLPRLFVEFQQLDGSYSKQHQGTGLGLALTRRLVQAQGGSVGVRSTRGQGSVFHLVLGRKPEVDSVSDGEAAAPVALTAGHRLLVIEDERHDQARLVQGLSDAGFQVDAASTGEQALRRALDRAYDAITLELLMPDQRGFGVLEGIRREGPSHETPVVGVTMPTDAGAAASFAITDVLCKPIRIDEIVSAMSRFRRPGPSRSNVMVIDDDPLALDLMRAALASIGIDARCHLDGRDALREVERLRPDAIILDLMMPEFDGFAVLDALQRLPECRDTPVFIWTSMILTDDEYAGLARSAETILRKGGGAFDSMLEALRRWRPPVTAPDEGGPR
jgi:PAS domain S-box-containing protein